MVSRRDHPYYRLLLASTLTCWLSLFCFVLDIYPGAPFGPDWEMIRNPAQLLVSGFFFVLPAGLFALFAVWPLVLLVVQAMFRIEPVIAARLNWPFWIIAGVILGPPALFAYSYPLGLGQTLLGNLILTGMICGALCATLCRALIGPEVAD
ncbi:hypothetical protein SAMN05518849_113103 [Sphingobium sp. AP50]|nr:hypothetical protein SAMN05518849_113103 [Sphingobium sp. AP50]